MDDPKAHNPKAQGALKAQGRPCSSEGFPSVPSHPVVPRTTKAPLSHSPQVAIFFSPLFFPPLHSSLKKTTDFPACLLVLY